MVFRCGQFTINVIDETKAFPTFSSQWKVTDIIEREAADIVLRISKFPISLVNPVSEGWMVDASCDKEKWIYSVSGDYLIGNNIEASTNNPKKATCCATLVGSALYVGGVFTEEEINSYNYNSATATSNFLESKGWTKITNYGDLEAGDIVIMTAEGSGGSIGHVQIYAGNGTWYNAGYTGAIQRDNPYSSDASGKFLWAWRINK